MKEEKAPRLKRSEIRAKPVKAARSGGAKHLKYPAVRVKV